MKKNKWFGWAFVAAMMGTGFSACTNEAEEVLAQESEIKLTSEITPSRVTSDLQSTQIAEGQEIGVTITGSKSGNDYVNKLWTSDGEGSLSTTHTVYWANTDIDVIAYHPYNAQWTSDTPTFTVSTDQSVETNYLNSDLLFASKTDVAKTESAISLTFSHKLAKINVTLVPEYEDMDLSDAVISICNTKISTTINLSDGIVTEATGNFEEIKAGTGKTASAIVVPQTIAASTKFIKVVLGSKTFYYTLPADKQLKSGYSHNYTLTVKETALAIANSSEIDNWTPDNGNTGDANEVNVIPNNEIWYTTTDKTIINMADYFDFGTTIKSNTYEEGKGIIKFNGDVTQLETAAFTEQEKLITITIPQSVSNIHNEEEYGIFLGCNNLKSIEVDSKNNNFSSIDGVLYNKNQTELIRYPSAIEGNFTIPQSVITIHKNAFLNCKSLSNVTINNSVTSIGYNAFQNSGLTELTIPGSIGVIESGTFANCKSLINVTIFSGVTSIGASAFRGCSSLTNIVLPSSCQEIKASFYQCTSLSNISITATTPPVIYDINNLPTGQNLAFDAFDTSIYETCKIYVPEGKVNDYNAAYGWSKFTNIIEIQE